ncbi:hypothetical protein BBH99_00260 [Chryseobacterium contaminans]|uniref:Uncharacterized protein n=1 Tax=Chryseobacterium contaminans TaxID=1423959 RepID=A0A1M6VN90_9FLAO|nr:hypothetical protein [Chryseobacterium contaminans]OCA80570.1 hypothetical protein BBH99_00260 [Chryseobacterium contaminans]SHK82834.1 hypothetical protein SAMN05444407_101285 [Chryseobacterium contaminans]
MEKKINSDIATILKEIIKENLNNYKHITLDSHYQDSKGNYHLKLTVLYEESISYVIQERKEINGNTITLNYLPKVSILKDLKTKEGYFFNIFPHSIVVKDNDRFLVNFKSSLIFYIEKNRTFIHKKSIDHVRWVASNYISEIKFQDSQYLRYKLYECLVKLYNLFSPVDYIDESMLPLLFSNPESHPYIADIVGDLLTDTDFEEKMILHLKSFGGILQTIDPHALFVDNEVVIVFKYEDLELESFIENVFFRFFSITKKVNHKISSFYWEKNSEGFFSLYIKADKDVIKHEILPELNIKLNSNIHIKQVSDITTIYDFCNEDYFKPLSSFSHYVLDMKNNEGIFWSDNLSISYCIELYISCFKNLNFSKEDFLKFNSYLSQKWQLLLLSDEEIISTEYSSIVTMYQKFEKLFVINEGSLLNNFSAKIDKWLTNDSFYEEINILRENMIIAIGKDEYSFVFKTIITNFSENYEYAFLEGFLFKFFGLMGLKNESKVYITYIINRLGNES